MMAVSCAKAALVMLFFMHLKYEANWKYVLTIPAAIMSVLLMLLLVPDIGWRYDTIIGGRTISRDQSERIATQETRELMLGEHGHDEHEHQPGEEH